MAKFSPTPWFVHVDYALSDATGRDFCKMLWSDSNELEQVEIDACLIQNAPELLEALQAFIALCDKTDPEGLFRGSVEIRARKAIANATGKQT